MGGLALEKFLVLSWLYCGFTIAIVGTTLEERESDCTRPYPLAYYSKVLAVYYCMRASSHTIWRWGRPKYPEIPTRRPFPPSQTYLGWLVLNLLILIELGFGRTLQI